MASGDPPPASGRKAADADVLGEAVPLKPPGSGDSADTALPVAPDASLLPESPPAEDENQPGFIGERNRPKP